MEAICNGGSWCRRQRSDGQVLMDVFAHCFGQGIVNDELEVSSVKKAVLWLLLPFVLCPLKFLMKLYCIVLIISI